eukprot:5310069-Amphidinium_carterae.1
MLGRLGFHSCVPTGSLHWIESRTLTTRSGTPLRLRWKRALTGCNLFTGPFWCTRQLSVSPSDQELPGQSVPEGVVRDNTSAASVQGWNFFSGRSFGCYPKVIGLYPVSLAEWTRRCQTIHGEMRAPFFDEELWLTEAPAAKYAEGGTLSSNRVVALGEVGDIASLSTDCLTEVLSSSDDNDSIWESLEPSKCPQAFVERGFASEEEE